MNACHTIREQLQAYLEDELPQGDRPAVDAHLADCESCRAAADGLGELFARLARPAIPDVPLRMKAGIMARVSAAGRRRRLLQTGVLAAAILVGVGIATVAAWEGMGDSLLAEVADWQVDDVWGSAAYAVTAFAEEVSEVEAAWPSSLASGPMLALLALAFVAVDALLLLRWRGLAVSDAGRTRTNR